MCVDFLISEMSAEDEPLKTSFQERYKVNMKKFVVTYLQKHALVQQMSTEP